MSVAAAGPAAAPPRFDGLRAVFINATLKPSPAPSNTDGLLRMSTRIMEELGVSVEVVRAVDHDIAVGDTVTIRSTADESADVQVVGTFEPPPFYPLIESINVSTQLFDSLYDRPRNRWTWANVAGA